MRPSAGASAMSPTSRKQSVSEAGPNYASTSGNGPTTFFMASEKMLDAQQTPTASVSESSFGIKSLVEDNAVAEADNDREDSNSNGRRRSTIKPRRLVQRDSSMDSLGLGSFAGSDDSSPSRAQKNPASITSASQPLTPLSYASPTFESSEAGSPKSMSLRSFRHSDDDSLDGRSSQAIMSDSEEEEEADLPASASMTAPQFIMPSIMMPSRRPFTPRGQELGKLKILLAGSSGAGKTSLIKSIVQLCEDIVHIDAITSANITKKESKKPRPHNVSYNKTKKITEMFASTKAYPNWWTDLEDSKVLRRRKSGDGTVLERNLCFIDTPGYDAGTSVLEGMENVTRYIESQMTKALNAANLEDTELLNLLGGSGGSQVDVVLYLIAHPLKPADIEFMRQLSNLTNVVPLLAKADTLPSSDMDRIKASISEDLCNAELRLFDIRPQGTTSSPLYTVCSSPSKDLENMDASLLMQSDYIQPLHPSNLSELLDQLLTKPSTQQLKHFAAKKIIQNRSVQRTSAAVPSPLRTNLTPGYSRSSTAPLLNESFSSVSQALIARPSGTMTYAQAAVTDHTLREERLARVHLANWAANLQRSLQNERARYEALVKAERAEWLKARLGECVFDDEIEPAADSRRNDMALICANVKKRKPSGERKSNLLMPRGSSFDPADPLGLMHWRDQIGATGLMALKVVGGCGVLGALVWWATRSWNLGAQSGAWTGEWWEGFD